MVVDKSIDLTKVAPYGCGFQTGAGTVLNVLEPGPADSLVVYGVGAVGLAALAAARHLGAGTLVAVDPMACRREAERFGAVGLDPRPRGPVVDRGQGAHRGRCVVRDRHHGDPRGGQAGPAVAQVRGTLVALGLGAEEYAIDAIDLLQNGKIMRSSIEGDSDPQEMVPRLIAMNGSGEFDVDHLIATYPFAEINTAVADVLAGKVVKPVLVW